MSPRKALIAGNWKMNKTVSESIAFAEQLKAAAAQFPAQVDVVVAPTSVALQATAHILKDTPIAVSSQNVYPGDEGAFTGEVSAKMLKDIGCSFGIVGHSERRQYFSEQGPLLRNKVDALLNAQITPIYCIGETLEQREAEQTFSLLQTQIEDVFAQRSAAQATQIVVAYEPIWAIGTGKTASPAQAQEVHQFLRNTLQKMFDPDTANAIRILYGGSVKPDNVDALMQQPDIDGALVGGASLKAESFQSLVGFANRV